MGDDLAKRLEMLLVLQWLDEGRPEDGTVVLSVSTAASELGLEMGRAGVLAVMGALGELEEEGLREGSPSRDPSGVDPRGHARPTSCAPMPATSSAASRGSLVV